jgi:hypothetical protein
MKVPPDMPEPIGAVCPYCKQVLEKKPKRKTKCPHCGGYIHVRKHPPNGQSTKLVTEQQAKRIDSERNELRFKRKWLAYLVQYGVREIDFDNQRKKLRSTYGQNPGGGDLVWSLFQGALHAAIKSGDVGELQMLYLDMALFLYEEGREFFVPLQQSLRMDVLYYKEHGFKGKLQIRVSDDCCQACRKLAGDIFTLDEALEQMPIPCKECTRQRYGGRPGWCRCQYYTVS